ncbi:MAG: ATP synthase F0 subunit A, partial [Wenyingzhuangia sp.]
MNLKVLAVLMLALVSSFTMNANQDQHPTGAHHGSSHLEHNDHSHEAHSHAETKSLNDGVNTKDEVAAYIDHHLGDSHDFIFFSDEAAGHHYGFPLPVILVDNGLQFFMSSEFHHGEALVEKNGQHYKLYHGKIYKTDAQGTISYDE